MGGKLDEVKGRAKKAAGEAAGDESLKTRGQVDKASGKAKKGIGKAAKHTKRGVRRAS